MRKIYGILFFITAFFLLLQRSPAQDSLSLVGRWVENCIDYTCVASMGDYVYAGKGNIFCVFDIMDPEHPKLLKQLKTDVKMKEIYLFDHYAAIGYDGIAIIDVSNPEKPVTLFSDTSYSHVHNFQAFGKSLYFISDNRMKALDLENMENPEITDAFSSDDGTTCFYLADNLAFVGRYYYNNWQDYIDIYNTEDITNPELIDTIQSEWDNEHLVYYDSILYSSNRLTIRIYNLRDIDNPKCIYDWQMHSCICSKIFIRDSMLFSFEEFYDIEYFNVSDIDNINSVGIFTTEIGSRNTDIRDYCVSDKYIITITNTLGLEISDIGKYKYPKLVWHSEKSEQFNKVVTNGRLEIKSRSDVTITDITDPLKPVLASTINNVAPDYMSIIKNSLLLFKNSNISVYDLTDPEKPIRTRSLKYDGDSVLQVEMLNDSMTVIRDDKNNLIVFTLNEAHDMTQLFRIQLSSCSYPAIYVSDNRILYLSEKIVDGRKRYYLKSAELTENLHLAVNTSDYSFPDTVGLKEAKIIFANKKYAVLRTTYSSKLLDIGDFNSCKILQNFSSVSPNSCTIVDSIIIFYSGSRCIFCNINDNTYSDYLASLYLPFLIKMDVCSGYFRVYQSNSVKLYDIKNINKLKHFPVTTFEYSSHGNFFVHHRNIYQYEYGTLYNPQNGFVVLDCSDPANIRRMNRVDIPVDASVYKLYKDNLLISNTITKSKNGDSLHVIGIDDSGNFQMKESSVFFPNSVYSLNIFDDLMIAVSYINFYICDISNIDSITILGEYKAQDPISYLSKWNNKVIICSSKDSCYIIDITDPSSPQKELSFPAKSKPNDYIRNMTVYKDYLLMQLYSDEDSSYFLSAIDLNKADYNSKKVLFKKKTYFNYSIEDGLMYVISTDEGLGIYDISDVNNIRYLTGYNPPGGAGAFQVEDSLIYLYNSNEGLYVLRFDRQVNGVEPGSGNPIISAVLVPNPTTDFCRLEINLPEDSNVKLELRDCLGNRVAAIADENRPAGCNIFLIDTKNLTSGMYFVTGTAGSRSVNQKLVIGK